MKNELCPPVVSFIKKSTFSFALFLNHQATHYILDSVHTSTFYQDDRVQVDSVFHFHVKYLLFLV